MKTKANILLTIATFIAYWAGLSNASAFYDPGAQRWLNRDPIQERGGINLFEFVANSSITHVDSFGWLLDCDALHNQCWRDCWNSKPPWPCEKGKRGHYAYCESKCLAEYMACEAANAAETTMKYCQQHPALCVGGIIIIILLPKPIPV